MNGARCTVAALLAVTMSVAVHSSETIDGCDTLDVASWMLGRWVSATDTGNYEESWIRVSATTFEGVGRVERKDNTLNQTESLRLVLMSGHVFYLAKVDENPLPVAFTLTSCGKQSLSFENKHHDFPQRITYTLSGDVMQVFVTGADDGGFSLQLHRSKQVSD